MADQDILAEAREAFKDACEAEDDNRRAGIADPFLIYGDPGSTAADSSDWTTAFVIDIMRKADFERQYKGAQAVDWDGDGYGELGEPWYRDNAVMRAEWWRREEVLRPIVLLSDGSVVEEAVFAAQAELFALQGV